jgi:hypothetical protein
MTGSAAQLEWAERIRRQVGAEFERVEALFRTIARGQCDEKLADTETILTIIEEKRAEVMKRSQAGYFIHDWQEITDQVRQMICKDPRYVAIKTKRASRP